MKKKKFCIPKILHTVTFENKIQPEKRLNPCFDISPPREGF